MATDHEKDRESVRNPNVRYEPRKINALLVVFVMAAMVISGVLIHFAVVGLWVYFDKGSKALDTNKNPILTAPPNQLPPNPRLQPDPVGDLHYLRTAEDNVLNTYGWVDKNAGVVRIPVARAMFLLSQQGLPNWGNAPAAAAQNAAKPQTSPAKPPAGSPGGR